MSKYNVDNERIKRQYLTFLKQAKGQSEASIDAVAGAIARFEEYTKYRNFKKYHYEQAIGFKRDLANHKHQKTGGPLSLATINSTTRHLKNFFQWLSQQSGYRSRVNYSDAEYFNISEKEARTAKAKRQKLVPTLDQVKHVLRVMPYSTSIEQRNRALIAFTLLTGARDSAVASFKLKHIDMVAAMAYQDAREVKTKFSKTFSTYFFPVGDEVLSIVEDWIQYLVEDCGFGNNDPLFPKALVGQGAEHNFQAMGIGKDHWSNASAIRKIFKEAFALAELPYFNPHSFRDTLAGLGQRTCRNPEEFKAWSQNLGHEKVMTTFINYGTVQTDRQAEIFRQFDGADRGFNAEDVKERVFEAVKKALRS